MGTQSSFYGLPYEIREKIYYLADIPSKRVFDLTVVPTFDGDTHFSIWSDPPLTEGRYGFEQEFYYCADEDDEYLRSVKGEGNVEEDAALWESMELPSRIRLKAIQDLLRVSRPVREEVLGILYGENLFYINVFRTSIPSLKQRITQYKRNTIRHLMLALVPGDHLDFTVDTEFWNPILSALKTLRLLVCQRLFTLSSLVPRAGSERCHGCGDGVLFRDYVNPLILVLEYVCQQLPTECQLFADIRGGWPGSLLGAMDDCFSQTNHRYMTTTMGNYEPREHNPNFHRFTYAQLFEIIAPP